MRLATAAFAALLLAGPAAQARETATPQLEPFEDLAHFEVDGAAGTLTLPPGAPDRRAPLVVLLHDGPDADGRGTRYADQLLAAGFGVLELTHVANEEGAANAVAAARRISRFEGQPVGALGFGEGGRLALRLPGPLAGRAALYPGCDGWAAPVAADIAGEAALLLHGAADAANTPAACAALADRLASAGARSVRWLAYAHAAYGWDRPRYGSEGEWSWQIRPGGAGRVRAQAWPELAAFSASEVAGFFASAFRAAAR